jgi:rod shape-determining protein MreD
VSLLRGVLVLIALTGLQAALGRFWPAAPRYVDLLSLPVVWYAVAAGQRAGMLVGCAAGLLQDAWFQVGAFGLTGFKKTLLGWALGGFAARFEVGRDGSRFLAGALFALADAALDLAIRPLLDLRSTTPAFGDVLVRAAATGLLAVWSFRLAGRFRGRRTSHGWVG